jgi:hypothetical protein
MTMARVLFLRGTALGGVGNDAYPGDIRDLPDVQASLYVAQGRAVIAVDAVPPPESAEVKPEPKKRGKQ